MSLSIRSDYSLRVPEKDEVKAVFGSFLRALRVTGGDIPALLYCIHNPTRIPPDDAKPANVYDDGIADQIRGWAEDERKEAMCDTWRKQEGRKSVAEVMRQHNASFDYAARVLREAGLRP